MANSVKVLGVEVFLKAMTNLTDVVGGIPATVPSEFDLGRAWRGLEEVHRGSKKLSAKERMRITKFIEF